MTRRDVGGRNGGCGRSDGRLRWTRGAGGPPKREKRAGFAGRRGAGLAIEIAAVRAVAQPEGAGSALSFSKAATKPRPTASLPAGEASPAARRRQAARRREGGGGEAASAASGRARR